MTEEAWFEPLRWKQAWVRGRGGRRCVPALTTEHMFRGVQWESTVKSFLKDNGTEVLGKVCR